MEETMEEKKERIRQWEKREKETAIGQKKAQAFCSFNIGADCECGNCGARW